ncbi:MAG: hypothetical protein HY062_01675 [Bacteroidetes bacterium]|nr:hypothetical protein [Bacteroidota bacterium]
MKTVYIIIAFCAGLFLGHLLFQTEREIEPSAFDQLEKQKEKLASIDTGYKSGSLNFHKQNDSLLKELKGYKFLLAESRTQLKSERNQVAVLLTRIKTNSDLPCDSVLIDSLSQSIVSVNLITDSLIHQYEVKDSTWQNLVAIRDTQIVLCNRSYMEMKNLAQEQLIREQQLTENLNTALKQQKRKRLQNRILAAGMLFVSGITTTLYIKSK